MGSGSMATLKAASSRSASRRKAVKGKNKAVAGPELAVPTAEKLSREARAQEARWKAEADLRTLREAEQIRTDRQRLRNATRMAAAEMKALEAIRKRNRA